MKILNLTQHQATKQQELDGVFAVDFDKSLLNFSSIPARDEVVQKAISLAQVAKISGAEAAMIGGAPYLMPELASQLKAVGITPLFSFTERVSEDMHLPDGTVQKVAVFCHVGFVEA